ncbi:hypothetical protein ACHAW6_003598 [Cyclotella cf. meneghiniana]
MMMILTNTHSIQSTLSPFHPLLIEGPSTDTRDPSQVAANIVSNLRRHWKERGITKPILLITQGDPLAETGISAISRRVAEELGLKRCLVCLDAEIDSQHSVLADRHDVLYELKYSQLVDVLNDGSEKQMPQGGNAESGPLLADRLTDAIDDRISYKNSKRKSMGNEPLASWCRNYALLQEVTKCAFKTICGEVTIAHTVEKVPEFGVTSFYEVGLHMGLINEDEDMVAYSS